VVAREVDVPIQHAVYLTVDASDVRRLVDRLDQIFHENNAARVYNPAFGLVFVPHSDRYWVFHNSNQVVADWLVQLRCRVEGPAVFSVWERGPRRAAEPEPFSGRGPRGQDSSRARDGSSEFCRRLICGARPGGHEGLAIVKKNYRGSSRPSCV
jgi:hypothetical protein